MADAINFPGTVEWSGENPGISLKETPDGPFVALASFFRVVLSPHGRGHALVLMQSPQDAKGPNFCFHDNEKLARYLVSDFVSHFGAWKGLPGLQGLTYRPLDSVAASGDPASTLQRDRQGRRHHGRPHLERARHAVLLRAAAGQVGDRQALDAEPVRAVRGRDDHGQRQDAARQAGAARDGGAQVLDRDAGVLRDVDQAPP